MVKQKSKGDAFLERFGTCANTATHVNWRYIVAITTYHVWRTALFIIFDNVSIVILITRPLHVLA